MSSNLNLRPAASPWAAHISERPQTLRFNDRLPQPGSADVSTQRLGFPDCQIFYIPPTTPVFFLIIFVLFSWISRNGPALTRRPLRSGPCPLPAPAVLSRTFLASMCCPLPHSSCFSCAARLPTPTCGRIRHHKTCMRSGPGPVRVSCKSDSLQARSQIQREDIDPRKSPAIGKSPGVCTKNGGLAQPCLWKPTVSPSSAAVMLEKDMLRTQTSGQKRPGQSLCFWVMEKSCQNVIKLFELELNKKCLCDLGFHGCPVNRENTIMGNTKGGSEPGKDTRRIPSTIRACGFMPQTGSEVWEMLAGACSSHIQSRFERQALDLEEAVTPHQGAYRIFQDSGLGGEGGRRCSRGLQAPSRPRSRGLWPWGRSHCCFCFSSWLSSWHAAVEQDLWWTRRGRWVVKVATWSGPVKKAELQPHLLLPSPRAASQSLLPSCTCFTYESCPLALR